MRTTVSLSKEQALKLIKVMERQAKTDEEKYPEHKNWKLEFNQDGTIMVWSGAHGFSTKEI